MLSDFPAVSQTDNPATPQDETGQYRIESVPDGQYQVREVEPRIGRWLLPPCGLRARAGAKPVCPEGERFCGVVVWKKDLPDYRRLL